ncbi:hypothetical protein VTO42DRAFT_7781 [Malbranchea cinnamomea]
MRLYSFTTRTCYISSWNRPTPLASENYQNATRATPTRLGVRGTASPVTCHTVLRRTYIGSWSTRERSLAVVWQNLAKYTLDTASGFCGMRRSEGGRRCGCRFERMASQGSQLVASLMAAGVEPYRLTLKLANMLVEHTSYDFCILLLCTLHSSRLCTADGDRLVSRTATAPGCLTISIGRHHSGVERRLFACDGGPVLGSWNMRVGIVSGLGKSLGGKTKGLDGIHNHPSTILRLLY